ncbi:Putative glycine rich membrane protein [Sandaracinus amylolyticus]|nr:Putative glycine rich membrane protein [Sandaracinus amylolyticus]
MRPMRGITTRSCALWIVALIAAFAVAFWPESVFAQGTGGSFGGGNWGGGGGGGGGGGSSSDDDGGGAAYLVFMLIRVLLVTVGPIPTLIIVALAGGAWLLVRGSRRNARDAGMPFGRPPAAGSPLWNQVDITAVRIAIDWRARAFVHERYLELAKGADARKKPGLVKHVAAIAQALDEARVAWLRAEVSNFHPMSPPEAEHHFRSLADGARAAIEADASGIADPDAHPAEGAVVITVIVAASRELVDVKANDANDLAIALRGLRNVQPHEMIAGDLVWSPPAEGAKLSTRELEARHPAMVVIAEHSIGARVICHACRAPFPRGIPRCPGCGAEVR